MVVLVFRILIGWDTQIISILLGWRVSANRIILLCDFRPSFNCFYFRARENFSNIFFLLHGRSFKADLSRVISQIKL